MSKRSPDDSHGIIDPKAELYTDGSFRVPGKDQAPLDFSIPFAETRSMRLRRLEQIERAKRDAEGFESEFHDAENDDDLNAD